MSQLWQSPSCIDAVFRPLFFIDTSDKRRIIFNFWRRRDTYDVTIQFFGWCKNHLNFLINQNKRYVITLINIKWYYYQNEMKLIFPSKQSLHNLSLLSIFKNLPHTNSSCKSFGAIGMWMLLCWNDYDKIHPFSLVNLLLEKVMTRGVNLEHILNRVV